MSGSAMGGKPLYCDTAFFVWEFTTRDKEAIALNQRHIKTKLNQKLDAVERAKNFKSNLLIKRITINTTVAIVIAGICCGLWYFLFYVEQQLQDNFVRKGCIFPREDYLHLLFPSSWQTSDQALRLAKELAPAIIITALNLILPLVFSSITKYEGHVTYERELAMSLFK